MCAIAGLVNIVRAVNALIISVPLLCLPGRVIVPLPVDQCKGNHRLGRKLSASRQSNMSQTDKSVPAPDGGWGWMVTFGAFMVHVIGK